MQAVSITNNEAVNVFLRRGGHEMCINLLHKALEGLRSVMSEDHTATEPLPRGACFSAVPVDEAESSTLMAASPANFFTIYPQAFTFQYNGRVVDEPSSFEVSVALLFNTGLAHHLRGMRHPTSCQSDLKEALHYYKLGLALVRQNAGICSQSNAFYLISLALLNNAGHVFEHFGHTHHAKKCRNNMENLLDKNEFFSIPEEQFEIFHSNVFFSKSSVIRAAPAA